MLRRILAGIVVVVSLTGFALAGPFEDGLAAFDSGDYAMALFLWGPLAEQGHARAQSRLGLMYAAGMGMPRDEDQAAYWWSRAAEQGETDAGFSLYLEAERGSASAQYNLGVMYYVGTVVLPDGRRAPRDFTEAARWYLLAAEQGHVPAQYNLAHAYNNGTGVLQDFAEAIRWYQLAAEQGHVHAQANLGLMYFKGRGVPRNLVIAHMWFNISAAQGDDRATQMRDEVARMMTPEQITEAQKMARESIAEHRN